MHIAENGGDPKRVFLVGHSSGAQLSLLIAADPKYLAVHGLSPADIAGVVGLSTPTDLEPRNNGKSYGDVLLRGHGADVFGRDAEIMKDASPVRHISKTLPPTLLLVGDHDFPMLEADAGTFARVAKEVGAVVDIEVIKDRDHMGMVRGLLTDKDPAFERLGKFIDKTGTK